VILAGHGRVEAAKLLGLETCPASALEHMTPEEKRAYVLADNKLALNAGWDEDLLAQELEALQQMDLDFSLRHRLLDPRDRRADRRAGSRGAG
jgi:ParB-like chromosome segregation protein Spo0J